jgi:hypothetical protein
MLNLLSFIFLTFSLFTKANGASVGPSALLPITNANVTLDGFTRRWVYIAWHWITISSHSSSISAVLAGGTFPGPTIEGNKVSSKALCTAVC